MDFNCQKVKNAVNVFSLFLLAEGSSLPPYFT